MKKSLVRFFHMVETRKSFHRNKSKMYNFLFIHKYFKSTELVQNKSTCCTHVITSRGLYNVLPHFSLAFVINVLIINRNHTGNLCTKQGNSLKKITVSNQEQVIMASIH